MNAAGIRLTRDVPAAPERVFAALTEGRLLGRWFCDAAESEPRVNGRLVMRWSRPGSSRRPFEARWVEFSPPLRAAYQGGHGDYRDGEAGRVWFVLAPAGEGTRLELHHELPERPGYDAHLATWREAWPRALERLAKLLAAAPG